MNMAGVFLLYRGAQMNEEWTRQRLANEEAAKEEEVRQLEISRLVVLNALNNMVREDPDGTIRTSAREFFTLSCHLPGRLPRRPGIPGAG